MTLARPAPGETRTWIVVWEIDDPVKVGDPRYWWDETQVASFRGQSSRVPDLAGKPKGQSVVSLRRSAHDESVELDLLVLPEGVETEVVRVPSNHFRGSDPERTYVIVSRERAATTEEREASAARGLPWPPEVEAIRQAWLAALATDDPVLVAETRKQLDAAFEEHGMIASPPLGDAGRAVEVQPGVFLQDERPKPNNKPPARAV